MQSAFLALSLYPDVLKKAQAELDAVVGPHRLPDFSDRDELVYVNALIKEALRWQNVAPLSIHHITISDEILDGYFLPAGTAVVPNSWCVDQYWPYNGQKLTIGHLVASGHQGVHARSGSVP